MPEYIDVPFDTDPDELSEQSFGYLQSEVENWTPTESNLERILIDAQNRISADTRNILARVPRGIYRYFGSIVGLPAVDATAAATVTTWTMVDNQGYTIPAGTLVGIRTAGDEVINFQTLLDVSVPPGSVSTAPGEVTIYASEAGASGSGLGSIGGPVTLQDPLAFVLPDGVVQEVITSGGQDAETDSEYLQRLSDHLALLGHALVVPRDFEAAARTQPGIDRALALDGYDPDTDTFDNDRTVGIAMLDVLGNDVGAPMSNDAIAYMDQYREINFVIKQVHPELTAVDVTYDVNVTPGATGMEGTINAAISEYLDAANWGRPAEQSTTAEGVTVPPANDWINQDTVYYFEIAQLISDLAGVDRLNTLTLGKNGGAQAAANVALDGAVSLPEVGVLAGTIH